MRPFCHFIIGQLLVIPILKSPDSSQDRTIGMKAIGFLY